GEVVAGERVDHETAVGSEGYGKAAIRPAMSWAGAENAIAAGFAAQASGVIIEKRHQADCLQVQRPQGRRFQTLFPGPRWQSGRRGGVSGERPCSGLGPASRSS